MSPHRSLDGPGGAQGGRGTKETQVRRKKYMLCISATKGETPDRGGGGVHNYQGRGGQDAKTKSVDIYLDLTGNMKFGISEDSTAEGGENKHKRSTEGESQFSARATGGQTAKGESGGRKHQGVTGSSKG